MRGRAHLTSFDLRMIATAAMTIDHIGYFLFPGTDWLRIIGRLAFPLYAFLAGEAFRHTHDRKLYLVRLLALGTLITVIKYFLDYYYLEADIFITIGLGFAGLWCLEEKKYWLALVPLAAGLLVNTEYGWYGMAMIPILYYLKGREYWAVPLIGALSCLYVSSSEWLACVSAGWPAPLAASSWLQAYAGAAGIFLPFYNGKPGPKVNKYWFYLYYPGHVILINMIGMALR